MNKEKMNKEKTIYLIIKSLSNLYIRYAIVLLALAKRLKNNKTIKISSKLLGKDIGINFSETAKLLRGLEKDGFINVDKTKNTYSYSLNVQKIKELIPVNTPEINKKYVDELLNKIGDSRFFQSAESREAFIYLIMLNKNKAEDPKENYNAMMKQEYLQSIGVMDENRRIFINSKIKQFKQNKKTNKDVIYTIIKSCTNLSERELFILLTIATRSKDNNPASMSVRTLDKYIGIDYRSVQKYLREIELKGLINIHKPTKDDMKNIRKTLNPIYMYSLNIQKIKELIPVNAPEINKDYVDKLLINITDTKFIQGNIARKSFRYLIMLNGEKPERPCKNRQIRSIHKHLKSVGLMDEKRNLK